MGSALIVDDEIDICTLLSQHLRKLGFQSTYCMTIKEAMERVSHSSFDLIFVDLNLKDGSGYDLLSSFTDEVKKARIIVISAYDSEHQKALEAGANDFVPKPFKKKSIEDALKRLNFLSNAS